MERLIAASIDWPAFTETSGTVIFTTSADDETWAGLTAGTDGSVVLAF
jgi:hypothetical protein